MKKVIVIAVDGTAASGKGTLAKKLAHHFGFAYLDTGSLYRLTALGVLEKNGDPTDPETALAAAKTIDTARSKDPKIRTAKIGRTAAIVAAIPAVRQELLDFQRNFAKQPPNAQGCVIDGRDIGTVVCPDADIKLFIDADVHVRSERRYIELTHAGDIITRESILIDLTNRDNADKKRKTSPLRPAVGAIQIDTTAKNAEEVFLTALDQINSRLLSHC